MRYLVSYTMTAAMTDDPSEYEAIPTVNGTIRTRERSLWREVRRKQNGNLKALPVGAAFWSRSAWPVICCWQAVRVAATRLPPARATPDGQGHHRRWPCVCRMFAGQPPGA